MLNNLLTMRMGLLVQAFFLRFLTQLKRRKTQDLVQAGFLCVLSKAQVPRKLSFFEKTQGISIKIRVILVKIGAIVGKIGEIMPKQHKNP